MKKIILVIQIVLVSFLFTNSIHAQSELEIGIVGLKSTDKEVRKSAVSALVKLKDKRAVTPLIEALKDGTRAAKFRARVAYALGFLNDKRAVVPLIAALMDANRSVRSFSARSLGRLKDKRAVAPLIAALEDDKSTVRSSAQNALERLSGK